MLAVNWICFEFYYKNVSKFDFKYKWSPSGVFFLERIVANLCFYKEKEANYVLSVIKNSWNGNSPIWKTFKNWFGRSALFSLQSLALYFANIYIWQLLRSHKFGKQKIRRWHGFYRLVLDRNISSLFSFSSTNARWPFRWRDKYSIFAEKLCWIFDLFVLSFAVGMETPMRNVLEVIDDIFDKLVTVNVKTLNLTLMDVFLIRGKPIFRSKNVWKEISSLYQIPFVTVFCGFLIMGRHIMFKVNVAKLIYFLIFFIDWFFEFKLSHLFCLEK